jgi:hypothetical protein
MCKPRWVNLIFVVAFTRWDRFATRLGLHLFVLCTPRTCKWQRGSNLCGYQQIAFSSWNLDLVPIGAFMTFSWRRTCSNGVASSASTWTRATAETRPKQLPHPSTDEGSAREQTNNFTDHDRDRRQQIERSWLLQNLWMTMMIWTMHQRELYMLSLLAIFASWIVMF